MTPDALDRLWDALLDLPPLEPHHAACREPTDDEQRAVAAAQERRGVVGEPEHAPG